MDLEIVERYFLVRHQITQGWLCGSSRVNESEESTLKKLSLLVGTCILLVAFTSLSAPAFGDHIRDPGCNESPYDNGFQIHDLDIDNVAGDDSTAYETACISGGALVCGTALDSLGETLNPFGPHFGHGCGASGWTPAEGTETLTDLAVIGVPPGVDLNL